MSDYELTEADIENMAYERACEKHRVIYIIQEIILLTVITFTTLVSALHIAQEVPPFGENGNQ